MSKYDFKIDLSANTSTGAILSRIPEGSTVLEFGCAAGRMTRYMKQQLDCQVYIVEYDREAYQVAREYAVDGLCDDILKLEWAEKFQSIAFDAIIFADVLEHLTAPEKVLEAAGKLLKDNGSIHISIPNITHNAILLKAYGEHFDYTPTGLLDDTHVHFWGLHNIEALADSCGLHVQTITGTTCSVRDTEQQVQIGKNRLLENVLHERQCGEVYQFVVTLCKYRTEKTAYMFECPTIPSKVYLNTGNGFSENEVVVLKAEYTGQGSYRLRGEIKNEGNLRGILLEPVEGQNCILQNLSVCQGQRKLQMSSPGAVALEDGLWLPEENSAVYADMSAEGESVTVAGEILLPGQRYIQILEQACASRSKNMLTETQDISEQASENEALKQDLCAYIFLANRKELRTLALEQQITELERQITELKQQVVMREQYAAELEQTVSRYENMNIIKLRHLVGRVVRGVKRRIKGLLGK